MTKAVGYWNSNRDSTGHAEELVGAFILPTSTIRYKLVEAVHAIKPLKKAGQTEDGR